MSLEKFMLLVILLLPTPAGSSEPPVVSQKILAQSSQSWDGTAFEYPDGVPELTVVRINIPAGVALPWHCHPVPLAGAVTKGRLTVQKPGGETVTIETGEGLIEVSRLWHRGRASEDTEIIVVYAGAVGQQLGFGQDAEAALTSQCD